MSRYSNGRASAANRTTTRGTPTTSRPVAYKNAGRRVRGARGQQRDSRASRGGTSWDPEEVWTSLASIGAISVELGRGDEAVSAAYLRAHRCRPWRAEALRDLAAYCRLKGQHEAAYEHARMIAGSRSNALQHRAYMWIDESVYQWRAL